MWRIHYCDAIMGTVASQVTSLTIIYTTVYSDADQSKHQSSPSLAFVWGIHRWPVNSPHKWPVTRKMFPFDNVIMLSTLLGPFQYENIILPIINIIRSHDCLLFIMEVPNTHGKTVFRLKRLRCLNIKISSYQYRNSHYKIRQSCESRIFIMEKDGFYTEK